MKKQTNHNTTIQILKDFYELSGYRCIYDDNNRIFPDLLMYNGKNLVWIEVDKISSQKDFDLQMLMKVTENAEYRHYSSKEVLKDKIIPTTKKIATSDKMKLEKFYDSTQSDKINFGYSDKIIINNEKRLVDKDPEWAKYCRKHFPNSFLR